MDYAPSSEMISFSQRTPLMFKNVSMQISLKGKMLKHQWNFKIIFIKTTEFSPCFQYSRCQNV